MRCFLAKKGRHTPCMLSSCTAASGLSRCLYRDSCFRPSITFFGFQIDRIISPSKSARRLLADSLLCRYSSLIYSLCLDLKPLYLLFYAQICGKLFNWLTPFHRMIPNLHPSIFHRFTTNREPTLCVLHRCISFLLLSFTLQFQFILMSRCTSLFNHITCTNACLQLHSWFWYRHRWLWSLSSNVKTAW